MNFVGGNFGVANLPLFEQGLATLVDSLRGRDGFFCSDNIVTWDKTLGFMTDPAFTTVFARHARDPVEVAIIWRTHVLCHFAKLARRRPGDFVELGAYRGTTAHIIADWVDLAATGKTYWLYDTFTHTGAEVNVKMPGHIDGLHASVVARFADCPHVRIIQGHVPDSFGQGFPDQIAFAHLDLNQAPAEVAALRAVLPRLVSGGVLVLDDYGWWVYRAQRAAEDPILAEFGLDVLELPTGQGVVIKP